MQLKRGLKCQESLARAVANSKGQRSAAGLALAEFVERRAAGEEVIVFPLRGKWLVGLAADVKAESDRVGGLSRARAEVAGHACRIRNARLGQAAKIRLLNSVKSAK